MRRWLFGLAVGASLGFGIAPSALAAPGDLDPSFGTGGRVAMQPANKAGSFTGVAIQPDGKIVLGGWVTANPGETDMAVTRLNPDGTPDTDFGSGGTMLVNVNDAGQRGNDIGYALALQDDGKIVLAGTSQQGSLVLDTVVRLNPSGSLDGSFDPGDADGAGIARGKIGAPYDVEITPAGKIVTAGTWRNIGQTVYDSFLERFNANGSDDMTFASPADSIFSFDSGGNDGINDMALQPDGGIIAVGGADIAGRSKDAVVERVVPGTAGLDSGFGTSGRRIYGFGAGSYDEAHAVAIEPGGKIDVAGYGSTAADFTLTRLTAGGELDPSLNGDSVVDTDFGGDDVALDIALMSGGKILLVGDGDKDMQFVRFQPGGLPDTTFGPGGKRTVSFPGTTFSGASAVAIQRDGKIVVAGGSNNAALVARLQGDPVGGGGGGGGGGGNTTKVPRCLGKKATVVGTNGKNKLKGTKRADVIVALGGNDTISSLGGNDVVCGGNGNDKISTGSGNDKVSGGNGKDKESGGPGNDKLAGDGGNDSISGDGGNDKESGGSGKDKLSGGPGKDGLNGGSGTDVLNGGSGKDKCAGRDRKKSC
jgi:uncharacterized delta-60 repeat protein